MVVKCWERGSHLCAREGQTEKGQSYAVHINAGPSRERGNLRWLPACAFHSSVKHFVRNRFWLVWDKGQCTIRNHCSKAISYEMRTLLLHSRKHGMRLLFSDKLYSTHDHITFWKSRRCLPSFFRVAWSCCSPNAGAAWHFQKLENVLGMHLCLLKRASDGNRSVQ